MATYDNRHWLLAHVRNSFVSTDDSGLCELVMLAEDLPRLLRRRARPAAPGQPEPPPQPEPPGALDGYPDLDRSDDDEPDPLADSYDLQHDMDFGLHRQRSNTAQRLEKMEHAQKKAAKIKVIKWEGPNNNLTEQETEQLFGKKKLTYVPSEVRSQQKSLLIKQLKSSPDLPQNEYLEFAVFDGAGQYGNPTKSYKIFMTMLPEDHRNYPITICIVASAKIKDLIGYTCYQYSVKHPDIVLGPVSSYGLFICEDDGEVDLDFPSLDPNEACSKFGFVCLGLVDITTKSSIKSADMQTHSIPDTGGFNVIVISDDSKSTDQSKTENIECKDKSKNLNKINDRSKSVIKTAKPVNRPNTTVTFEFDNRTTGVIFDSFHRSEPFRNSRKGNSAPCQTENANSIPMYTPLLKHSFTPQDIDALKRIKVHELSIEAPVYQSYQVQIVNKMRANTHVHLGISGEKIEIDPILSISQLFWPRIKPISYNIDSIASCEIFDARSNRTIFRLVYSNSYSNNQDPGLSGFRLSAPSFNTSSFKHLDFECDYDTASTIVVKVNMIMDLKSSVCRKEYKSTLKRKVSTGKSFLLPKYH